MTNSDVSVESGTADGVKWGKFIYVPRYIDTRNKGYCEEVYMIKTVYEHIYTINIQLMKKYWNRTWRSGYLQREKFTRCLTLLIAPVLPVPPKFIIHSLTQ